MICSGCGQALIWIQFRDLFNRAWAIRGNTNGTIHRCQAQKELRLR